MVGGRWTMIALLAGGVLAGCAQPTPGRTRALGEVRFEAAFASAREVMAQYFPIADADADAGVIRSRPQAVEAPPERLLGRSPARQVATLRLYRENGQVVAQASVAVQREGSAGHRQLSAAGDSYDTVPNKTPADAEAATTAEQNQVWETERYDHALEARILADIYAGLHPEARS